MAQGPKDDVFLSKGFGTKRIGERTVVTEENPSTDQKFFEATISFVKAYDPFGVY